MRIRLIKKLASYLNGIDLTGRQVGDVFECADAEGRMLLSERWAEQVESGKVSRPRPPSADKKSE